MNSFFLVFLFTISIFANGFGANIIDFSFVKNDIIVLHISEDHVDHFKLFESNEEDVIFKNALDVSKAQDINSYLLEENLNCADQGITNEIQEIGRKSKLADVKGAWSDPDRVLKHWIFL